MSDERRGESQIARRLTRINCVNLPSNKMQRAFEKDENRGPRDRREQTVADAPFRLIEAAVINESGYNSPNEGSPETAELSRAVATAEAGAELGEAQFHCLAVLTLACGFGVG